MPAFHETPIDSPVTEFALLLVGFGDDRVLPIGSGFIVAPYVAITALHVMEEFYSQFCPGTNWKPGTTVDCQFQVLGLQYCRRAEPNVWRVTKAVGASHTDIAFLQLIPDNDGSNAYRFERRIGLNLSAPKVGEQVAGFGYPRSQAELLNPSTLQWAIAPTTSAGLVTQVFEEHRDKGMLHFPCFEIDSRTDGGMSGGPVFNSRGDCCWVISAGSNLPCGKFTSYASTLWPAMGTTLEFDTPNLRYTGPYAAIELCLIGVVPSPDWQKYYGRIFEVERDPLGSAKPRIKLS